MDEDIFSNTIDVEGIYIEKGREQARLELEGKLVDTGAYDTGLQHGKLVGEEFGFYVGVISQFEKVLQASCTNVEKVDSTLCGAMWSMQRRSRILSNIETLKTTISKFCSTPPSSKNFDKHATNIRFLYKKICAMILIKDKSFLVFGENSAKDGSNGGNSQRNSGAQSLEF